MITEFQTRHCRFCWSPTSFKTHQVIVFNELFRSGPESLLQCPSTNLILFSKHHRVACKQAGTPNSARRYPAQTVAPLQHQLHQCRNKAPEGRNKALEKLSPPGKGASRLSLHSLENQQRWTNSGVSGSDALVLAMKERLGPGLASALFVLCRQCPGTRSSSSPIRFFRPLPENRNTFTNYSLRRASVRLVNSGFISTALGVGKRVATLWPEGWTQSPCWPQNVNCAGV